MQSLLEFGDPAKGVKPLEKIFESVGKDNHKEFSAYLIALREQDILKWNKEVLKTGAYLSMVLALSFTCTECKG